MSDFLSDQWFEELNERLATGAALPSDARACQVVVEFEHAPSTLPHALTLTVNEGARVAPGDSRGADVILRLSIEDAKALSAGELDSASALRDGRLKVRGDVNVVVPLAGWLHSALFG